MKILKSDINIWRVSNGLKIGLLCIGLLFISNSKVGAAVTSPYIVDEKPQVHFGDVAEIIDGDKAYFGLENYQHDYVNEYLHMSYTYTHNTCCYDTHTPQVYITQFDPRSTTTPIVKSLLFVYPFSPGESTDWYLIDIQFDETGYMISVKRRGVSEIYNIHAVVENLVPGDWVALANNHPLGPDNVPVADSMSFTPLLYITDVAPPPSKNPVIIVPGIMGSKIEDPKAASSAEKWPNLPLMVLPGNDSYLDELMLDTSGNSQKILNATSIIRQIENNVFFSGLFDQLYIRDYKDNRDLFEMPYDWRQDISNEVEKLKENIEYVKDTTGATKVNLVAHSMGGLLVKKYLKQYGGSSVNLFVDIATPHLGAAKAFKILSYGDDMGFKPLGISILDANEVKKIAQNMPSVYELLPSQDYFDSNNNNYKYYVWDGINQNSRLTFEQTKNYLKSTGRNSILIDKADAFHREIDGLNPADYGVKTYNIVGCGIPTIGQFYILSQKSDGTYEYNIKVINGDGTVPIKSAYAIPAFKTYFASGAIHATMPSTSGIQELVVNLLSGEEEPDISNYSNLFINESGCPKLEGKLVSFHSPIDLHVYDQEGNHVGPNSNGDIEEGIHGVVYEIIDGNKFAYLPEGKEYIIKGNATDSGTFNARIEKIHEENVIETKYFYEIPLINTTEVLVNNDSISIDDNGDSIFEKEIFASSILDERQSQDFIKPSTSIVLTGNKQKDGTYSSSVNVKLSAIDDNSGVLKTEYTLSEGFKWSAYSVPFAVNTKGQSQLMYRSIDNAGNAEVPKSIIININKK